VDSSASKIAKMIFWHWPDVLKFPPLPSLKVYFVMFAQSFLRNKEALHDHFLILCPSHLFGVY
jgi:hypothetical protein